MNVLLEAQAFLDRLDPIERELDDEESGHAQEETPALLRDTTARLSGYLGALHIGLIRPTGG